MKRCLLYISFLFTFILSSWGQCPAPSGLISDGESIQYNLYFNWKFIWIKAGEAEFKTHSILYEDQNAFETTLLASTNKTADAIFRLRDTISTIVTPQIVPLYFSKRCNEDGDIINDHAWFSYQDTMCITHQMKVYKDGHMRESNHTDSRCIYDMISLLLYSRSFQTDTLHIGQQLTFPMVSGIKVEDQHLVYRGKQEIETLSKKVYRCQVFSLSVTKKNKKGQPEEKEIMRFYATDDQNHLPILLDLNLKFGCATAKLSHISGCKYPLTSLVRRR